MKEDLKQTNQTAAEERQKVRKSSGAGSTPARRVARVAVLVALAMILSYVETLIPVNFGVPGIKLGLAKKLAKEMGASYFQMDRLSEDQLLHIWRRTAARA